MKLKHQATFANIFLGFCVGIILHMFCWLLEPYWFKFEFLEYPLPIATKEVYPGSNVWIITHYKMSKIVGIDLKYNVVDANENMENFINNNEAIGPDYYKNNADYRISPKKEMNFVDKSIRLDKQVECGVYKKYFISATFHLNPLRQDVVKWFETEPFYVNCSCGV